MNAGKLDIHIRQKQNEHIEGTKARTSRIERDTENGKKSTYFYSGTDVETLLAGRFGTGTIVFDSEKSIYPTEFISFDKPIGKAYDFGRKIYVDVSRVAVQYSSKGVHAYPVKDW